MSDTLKDAAEACGIDYIADEIANRIPKANGKYRSDKHICTLFESTCTNGDCRDCNFPIVYALKDISQFLIMLRGR